MPELLEYKCPNCGGAIGFNSGTQTLKCPYCDSEFEVQALKERDEALKLGDHDDMNWSQTVGADWDPGETDSLISYVCNSCGGEIIADRDTAATKCPFCSSPVVVSGNLSGSLKPDYVIPFKLDRNAAVSAYKRHISGKRLIPKTFKDENHINEIKGIYVPFWLFNADADAYSNYKATRVRTWSDSRYIYTETSHYSLLRSGSIEFKYVPVDGSSKMPDDIMESIEPFDFSAAVDFQTAYLAGYFADKYDVTSAESVNRANERIKRSSEVQLRQTVSGYSTVVPVNTSVRLSNTRTGYALYPVWMLNTQWQGKSYTFAMNGQTGKFVGNLPLDKIAFWKWFIGIAAAASAASFAVIMLLLSL